MSNIFLSFLGTNNYFPCNYTQAGHEPVNNVRFVQEAILSWNCMNWGNDDKIVIFTTDESHKKNWIDNGHKDQTGKTLYCTGLKNRLSQIKGDFQVKEVLIPTGKNENEIWLIFSRIVEEIDRDADLFLDITHAFRSLPLLATVVINYAKILKNITVRSISYGAMEALGEARKVQQMDIKMRNVPVFNLLAFDQLLDWSTAIDRFIVSGDSSKIHKLTSDNVKTIKRKIGGPDKEADGLKKMSTSLHHFTETLTTCRSKNISNHASQLKETIRTAKSQQLIKPLSLLLTKLENTLSGFSNDEVWDGIAAAKWCLQHNLIQQGITLLLETGFTYILRQATDENAHEKNSRELVGRALGIQRNKIPFSKWDDTSKEHKQTIDRICQWFNDHEDFFNSMTKLTNMRNDINHAGMRDNPVTPRKFKNTLNDSLELFQKQIL